MADPVFLAFKGKFVENPWDIMKSTHSTARAKAQGMPSTRVQAEGLRVDTERRF